MNATRQISRFRTNPVEILIFLVVIGIFGNSLYELLYIHNGFHPTALSPMTSDPISEGRRSLASVATPSQSNVLSLSTLEASCDEHASKDTLAEKVRISGSLCGETLDSKSTRHQKITIINQTNQFSATVFTDSNSLKYSTDYISLAPGMNNIQIEMTHSNGNIKKQSLEITKK